MERDSPKAYRVGEKYFKFFIMEKDTKIQLANDLELVVLSKTRQMFGFSTLLQPEIFPISNTHWEELTCVGFNPSHRRIEAIVNIKQASGYSGNLCSKSSHEFVRFFVDFKNGTGFQDMGFTSFKVADISDAPAGPQHPISYMASLFINDDKYKKFLQCGEAVIPTVRAVLSWNIAPSSDPNAFVTYGNHVDADIQLERLNIIWWKDLAADFNLNQAFGLFEPLTPIPLLAPKVADLHEIYKINQAADVSVHRTLYTTLGKQFAKNLNFSKSFASLAVTDFNALKIDISQFIDFFNLDGKKADIGFEELTCIGLNTASNTLGAVFHVKKQNGFSGNMCTKGSLEHVAFWADWNNNGTFDEYLGTASVNVHDINNMPEGGLYYNVALPIDTSSRLKSCKTPNIIRIRAVLSWESLPSTTNPNQLNHWGNYHDALVQLKPIGVQGEALSVITHVGGADRELIDPIEHLFNFNASNPSSNNNRPWGGLINFNGIIDRNGLGGDIKYRILWKKNGAFDTDFLPVSTSEIFRLDDLNTVAPAFNDFQSDPNGWFIYKQNPAIQLYNIDNYLAGWNTRILLDGIYTLRFVIMDNNGNETIADEFSIALCNKGMSISPTANSSIDFSSDIDLVIDGGDCHSYDVNNSVIQGHLRAVHPYFESWNLDIQPVSHTHATSPSPSSRAYNALSDSGDSNLLWRLDVSKLDPCGYTIAIGAHTRVILDSSTQLPYYAPKAVGFAKLP